MRSRKSCRWRGGSGSSGGDEGINKPAQRQNRQYCAMDFVVDIQCFKLWNNEWAPKELAILPLEKGRRVIGLMQHTFRPPCPWEYLPYYTQRENEWLERNHLHMKWTDGMDSFNLLRPILINTLHDARTIYVKGPEKAKWLSRYVKRVQELGEVMQCPAISTLKSMNIGPYECRYHGNIISGVCAVQNVTVLAQFIKIQRPSLERSMAIYNDVLNLSLMTSEDIAKLPREFIITTAAHSVDAAWEKLKNKYENDFEVTLCLKCRIHNHSDQFVLPMRRDCKACKACYTSIDTVC